MNKKKHFFMTNCKKKKILLSFILSNLFMFLGTILKLNHIAFAFANIILAIGLLIGFVFLYFLISFIIKAK